MDNTKKTDKFFKRVFLTGLVAMLPLFVTLYLFLFIYKLIISNIMPILSSVLKQFGVNMTDFLLGITSVVVFIIIVFMVGLFVKFYVGRVLWSFFEKVLLKIPVFSNIYRGVRQVVDSFKSTGNNFEKVVLVEFPKEGVYCVGYVVKSTQKIFEETVGEPCYNVFVPTAPNPTSGFITIIPKRCCRELPITVEDGVKFVFSVGILDINNKNETQPKPNDKKTE